MTNQLFKENVPLGKFLNLLKTSCEIEINNEKNEVTIELNKTIYKKLVYLDVYNPFLKSIINNYYLSKRHYIEKTQNYNTFLTICRQICKSHNIKYFSKILYDKSKYEIIYFIKLDKDLYDNEILVN
tara:strand:+ start:113 stop:493 length:381 start_codon:yes stop_codon:yes gene_type:complete